MPRRPPTSITPPPEGRADTQIGAKIKGKSADQLRKDAAAAVADKKFKDASAFLGAAVTANPKDAGAWLALAKLGAQADDAQADGRYDMVARGQTAAYAAYSRASGVPAQRALPIPPLKNGRP